MGRSFSWGLVCLQEGFKGEVKPLRPAGAELVPKGCRALPAGRPRLALTSLRSSPRFWPPLFFLKSFPFPQWSLLCTISILFSQTLICLFCHTGD